MLKLIRVISMLGALIFIALMLFDVSPKKELRIAEAALRHYDPDTAILPQVGLFDTFCTI